MINENITYVTYVYDSTRLYDIIFYIIILSYQSTQNFNQTYVENT